MSSSKSPEIATTERIRQLAAARQQTLALEPAEAMQAIFEHPQPAALVHSFTGEDLHFLIHDIGLENALPLIALASNRQWEYFLDTEIWHRDRLNIPRTTAWLQLLLQADSQRLTSWCFEEKLEFLELYLFRNIEVCIRESDQAPSDLGEGFFTDDDTFYIRFVDYPTETPEEESIKALRNDMLGQLLRRLSIYDHPRYQGLLLEAASLIPGETEEALFRLRNVRLAEKGFLPFDEAIGVYQPLRPGDLEARSQKIMRPAENDHSLLPAPQFSAVFLDGDDLFARALKGISKAPVLQQLQSEVASLCNQVIAADQMVIRGRRQLQVVVDKVSSYLSIGLERITVAASHQPEPRACAAIQRHMLADIFRTGYSCALELKWQADRWYRESWSFNRKIDLTFWGENWLGQLGGLLIKRPQFYDPNLPETNYRDFTAMDEIEQTRNALEQVMALDQLFSRLGLKNENVSAHPFADYKNLLLTQWARSCSNLPPVDVGTSDVTIGLDSFKNFYRSLWTPTPHGAIIEDARKSDFLEWIAHTCEMPSEEVSRRLGWVFEALFDEITEELANVATGNLEPRHIHLFLLKA